MIAGLEKRAWTETLMFSAAAFLLFQVSLLFFLFAVPLFLLGLKRGQQPFLISAVLVAAAVVVQSGIRAAGLEANGPVGWFFFSLEAGYPLALIIGVAAVLWEKGRSLYGMLKAAVLVAVLSFPVVAVFSGNTQVTAFLQEQVSYIVQGLRESFSQSAGAAQSGALLAGMNTQEFVTFLGQLYIRNYLFGYFLLLTASWYIARGIYARLSGSGSFALTGFYMPEKLLWPFLVSWAGDRKSVV